MIEYPAALAQAQQLLERPGRVLLGITGSPGSGKTSLAERLVDDLNAHAQGTAAHVPMDGFHLAAGTLARLGRSERKGAIDTFDGWGYATLLARLATDREHPIYAPNFDRRLEEPVAGSIEVTPGTRIVVSEGNYLLAEEPPWAELGGRFAEVWFCVAPESVRLERLIARHMAFGRTRADAAARASAVDGVNARLIESTRFRATREVSTA